MTDPVFDLLKHLLERQKEHDGVEIPLDDVVVPVQMEILGKANFSEISDSNIIIKGEYEDLQGRRVASCILRLTLPQACRVAVMLIDAVQKQLEKIEAEENDD